MAQSFFKTQAKQQDSYAIYLSDATAIYKQSNNISENVFISQLKLMSQLNMCMQATSPNSR